MYNSREVFDYKALGKKIKIARNRMKYSQEKVAELTNLSDKYISDIERGVKRARISTIIDIANCLAMDSDQLFYPWLHTTIAKYEPTLNKRLESLPPEQRAFIGATIETMIDEFVKLNLETK